MKDRLADWLDTHESIERRIAIGFLLVAGLYVAGHVIAYVI